VTWNNNAVDGGPVRSGVNGYHVYRDGLRVGFRQKQATPPGANETFDDSFGLAPGFTYRYTVTAVDHAGFESAPSAPFDFTVPGDCSSVVTLGDRPTLVYKVYFSDTSAPTGISPASLDETLFGGPGVARSMRDFFLEASYGSATFHRASASPVSWQMLPGDTATYCTPACNHGMIAADAIDATGVTPAPGDVTLFFVAGVQNSSKAGPGSVVFGVDGADSADAMMALIAHEVSHSFERRHAGSWICPGYTKGPGPNVANIHFGCIANGYGDSVSPLGSGTIRHQPAFTKRVMGFLGVFNSQTATGDGVYTIGRLEDAAGYAVQDFRVPARTDSASPHFLKAPFYALEYRTLTGYDGPLGDSTADPAGFEGVLIRLVPSTRQYGDTNTFLLPHKMLQPVAGADVFYDETRGIGIQLLTADGLNATVQVCGFTQVCPPEIIGN
jgi:hypothetical protein